MKTYQIKDEIAYRTLGEEAVLLNPDDNQIHLLSEVACFTWDILKETKNCDELVHAICKEFDVSEEQASKDTSQFLEELESKGLVDVHDR